MEDSWAYMDKAEWSVFGVPIIVWLGGVAILLWLWGEWQIRRWRREEKDERQLGDGDDD